MSRRIFDLRVVDMWKHEPRDGRLLWLVWLRLPLCERSVRQPAHLLLRPGVRELRIEQWKDHLSHYANVELVLRQLFHAGAQAHLLLRAGLRFVPALLAMAILVTVLTLLVIILTVLVCGVLRTHAEIIRAVQQYGAALETDSPEQHLLAPTAGAVFDALGIAGETQWGERVDYPLWAAEQEDTLLAFLTTTCLACQTFWDAFRDPDVSLPAHTRLIIVTKDRRHESRSRLRKIAPAHHDVVMSGDAWSSYQVPVAPYFVFISGADAKVVGQGSAEQWHQLEGMVALTRDEDQLAAEDRGTAAANRPVSSLM